jgi:F0F1-type ATP synthase membrane subunit b/b'
MSDYESNEEKEFEETKANSEEVLDDAGEELENAGDKVKAATKAVGNKLADPDRDLDIEYQKEKIKEDLD